MYLNLWIFLHTVMSPSAPTNVTGSALNTSVTLMWSQSSIDVVTDYIVSYTSSGRCSDAPSGSRTASGSPYTLSILEENTPYQINIVVMNRRGMSSPATYTTTTLSSGEFTSHVKPQIHINFLCSS